MARSGGALKMAEQAPIKTYIGPKPKQTKKTKKPKAKK